MRTTLNIDDEVLHAARELAEQQNLSTSRVVSQLLHQALTGRTGGTERASAEGAAGSRPVSPGGRAGDRDPTERLRDEGGM